MVWWWVSGVGSRRQNGRFLARMPMRLAHKQQRQQQTGQGKPNAEQEWLGPQRVGGGEIASRDRCQGDRHVASRFIDAHGKSTARGSHQVDLHYDGGGAAE